jgi:hypothetical protein
MPSSNQQRNRSKRIQEAKKRSATTFELIQQHDLRPLAAFLGIKEELLEKAQFVDLMETDDDYAGRDYRITLSERIQ